MALINRIKHQTNIYGRVYRMYHFFLRNALGIGKKKMILAIKWTAYSHLNIISMERYSSRMEFDARIHKCFDLTVISEMTDKNKCADMSCKEKMK